MNFLHSSFLMPHSCNTFNISNPKGSLKREKRVGHSFPTNGGTQPATTLKENQIKFKVVKNEK